MRVCPAWLVRAAACVVVGVVYPSAAFPQNTAPHRGELIWRIDSLVDAEMERAPIAGISLAVEHGGELLMAKGYGYADVEHSAPVTAETIFRLGSITKQFTALAILQLIDQGKIWLDDEITKYLPDYPTQGHRVTIHHLLTHTSGIKSYTGLGPKFWDIARLDLSHDELLALFKDEPFDFAPGEKWAYNNSGYYLLGMIVEKASGQSYADYLQAHIFGPLGMTGSSYCDQKAIVHHRARGYSRDEGHLVNADPLSLNAPGGAGALCSTVLDLLTWQGALDENSLITQASRDLMVTEAKLNDGSETGYAYGLFLGDLEGRRMIQHGGGINGFVTALSGFPDDDLTVVVLTNTDGGPSGRLASLIARVVLGIPMPVVEDLAMPSGWQDRYPGTYDAGGFEVRVYTEGDSLMVDAAGIMSRLLYQGEGAFVVAASPDMRVEFEITGSRASAIVLVAGGARIRGERVKK